MPKRLKIAAGILFFALMFFYLGLRIYMGFIVPSQYSRRGWSAEENNGRKMITVLGTASPAAGLLEVDDEVIELRSSRAAAMPVVTKEPWRVPKGTAYTLVIRRNGDLRAIDLRTASLFTYGPGGIFLVIFLFTVLLFLATGCAVFALKPDDNQAWLLALMLGSLVALIPVNMQIRLTGAVLALTFLAQMASSIFLPVFLHFFLVFPAPSPVLARFPSLERVLYWPYLLLILPLFGIARNLVRLGIGGDWLSAFLLNWFDYFVAVAALSYMLGGLLSLVLNYKAAEMVDRRRLRVVMFGSGAGFFNILLMPLGEMVGLNRLLPVIWRVLDIGLLFTLPLIPLSFAYAIIRHRVIPISLIIRRSVRYLLVSRGSTVLLLTGAAIIAAILLTWILDRLKPSGFVVGVVSATVGIFVWLLSDRLHRRYVAPLIDRRFFRQAYDAREIISNLARSLRSTTDLPRICEEVGLSLLTALQTENVHVFLREGDDPEYREHYACRFGQSKSVPIRIETDIRLSTEWDIVRRLAESGEPMEIDLSDRPGTADRTDSGSASSETSTLIQLRSAMLLPLVTKSGPAGIVSLGPRLGDLTFTGDDKRLLKSVAGPASFAVENARLIERMVEEARLRRELEAEKELKERELEEARQLQLSMLPSKLPSLPGIELHAAMRTATEVGGDFYDFHLHDDGTLTVAVGDATGHGLKAGTMVTAAKSLFNHLAEEESMVGILRQSSIALKRMNLRSLFMALMLVRVRGGGVTLSSAGMPPALLYRSSTGVIEEIAINGMPLGSMTNFPYRQAEFELAAGDVLLLMSDGLPERFNDTGEMLDYDRIRDALSDLAERKPSEIVEGLIRIGDQWAAGRQLDDDMTFVVIKMSA